jgi:hypothetical protein
MPDNITSQTVRIIHFDDEVNTVSSIPNNLFYTYNAERRHWVVHTSVVRRKFVEKFELRPDNTQSVLVSYELIDDVDELRAKLNDVKASADLIHSTIAIFDLMRARSDSNNPETIGLEFYQMARDDVKILPNRLFILSGFPRLFENQHPEVVFPTGQLLEKPFAAADLVRRIVKLMPECVRF